MRDVVIKSIFLRLCSLSLSWLIPLVTSRLVLLMSQSLLMARSRKCGKIRTGLHLDMWSVKSDIYLTILYRSFIVSQTHYFYQQDLLVCSI